VLCCPARAHFCPSAVSLLFLFALSACLQCRSLAVVCHRYHPLIVAASFYLLQRSVVFSSCSCLPLRYLSFMYVRLCSSFESVLKLVGFPLVLLEISAVIGSLAVTVICENSLP